MDELSEEDKLTVARVSLVYGQMKKFRVGLKVSFINRCSFFDVAKVFTGSDGVQVPLDVTIDSFKRVVAGEFDHLPEAAFYMVSGVLMRLLKKLEKLLFTRSSKVA